MELSREEIKRQLARERSRRYRERNPEKVKEARKRWRENNRDRVRELNRQWAKANPENARAAYKRWARKNPDKLAGYFRRWARENPEANRERKRRYRARVQAIRQQIAASGERQRAALLANDVYAVAAGAVSRDLPRWLRDDVISEVVLSILEGRAEISDATAAAKAALSRHRAALYRELSLNVPAFEGGPDRIDLLTADEFEGVDE